MKTLIALTLLLTACKAAEEHHEVAEPAFLGNAACPKSGDPIDPASYFEHEGQRVWFCNPVCAEEGSQDPEAWIARAYPEPVDLGNAACPVTGEPVADGPVVRWQGYRVHLCCSTCESAFDYEPEGYVREALEQ